MQDHEYRDDPLREFEGTYGDDQGDDDEGEEPELKTYHRLVGWAAGGDGVASKGFAVGIPIGNVFAFHPGSVGEYRMRLGRNDEGEATLTRIPRREWPELRGVPQPEPVRVTEGVEIDINYWRPEDVPRCTRCDHCHAGKYPTPQPGDPAGVMVCWVEVEPDVAAERKRRREEQEARWKAKFDRRHEAARKAAATRKANAAKDPAATAEKRRAAALKAQATRKANAAKRRARSVAEAQARKAGRS
jgi:hypothetical protein